MAVERQIELKRRYSRKKKMLKLKTRLASATGEARDKVLGKIKRLSPLWTEASLNQSQSGRAPATAKKPAKKKA
jgi:hypothetical protein